jgi:hypothetical protein
MGDFVPTSEPACIAILLILLDVIDLRYPGPGARLA